MQTPMELARHAVWSQMDAALLMLEDCVRQCPAEHWDSPIAKYPFWQVAYHTLCFVDLYLARDEREWQPRTGEGGLHPAGWAELDEEYPSRRFTQEEILGYLALCRRLARESIGRESAESLAGPSGFARRKISRLEMHIYNLRHVQHHAGQLSASLRRVGVDTRWVSAGEAPAGA